MMFLKFRLAVLETVESTSRVTLLGGKLCEKPLSEYGGMYLLYIPKVHNYYVHSRRTSA
jgi:hypothetical protein